MSIHVLWRLSTWSLEIPVTSSSLSSPLSPPFSVLDGLVPQESKHSGSFQNLNQQLQMMQMMEPFDQLPIKKQKRLANHCMSFMSLSIHFICLSRWRRLSFCYTLLIIFNPPIRRKMHHSKTSTEAPYTSRRPSICRETAWTIEDRTPVSPSSTNMTLKLDPWTNPQGKHKQASFDLCLHQGS